MPPRTKKPHFVPAAYLQFWDSGGVPSGRESKIWWCDGKVSKQQRVKNIAVQSGLYSAKNPNAAEAYLNEFEVDWAKLVFQLASGRLPKPDVLASLLILQSSHFLLRNPKFVNKDVDERINVYKNAVQGFWQQVLMAGDIPDKLENAAKRMLSVWSCHLLRAQGEPWITSDNPVMLLSHKGATPAVIFLPINPTWALISLRADAVNLSRKTITPQDTEFLNSYTAINSIRHIYCNKMFEKGEIASFAKWLARRPDTENWISNGQIHIEPFTYPVHGMRLGFL